MVAPSTDTKVQDQSTVINIAIDSPHGILIRCWQRNHFLASTLSTPLDGGNGVVTSIARRDPVMCPYRIPGCAFRYFNMRETTGDKPTSRDITTMLSLGRSRATASGFQLQARIDELARHEPKMMEQGRRPLEDREQHRQHFRGQVIILERTFMGAVRWSIN